MKQFTLDFEKPLRELEVKIDELEEQAQRGDAGLDGDIKKLRCKAEKLRKDIYSSLTRWQQVQLARHPQRPYAMDYISRITDSFIELHGDRNFREDKAVIAGLGVLRKKNNRKDGGSADNYRMRVAIIAQQKGRGTKENLERNFAMPHPEGYRKARRIMRLAEKFDLPVLTLIDTPGAYPGLGAEERGQAAAIAENLYEMAQLEVPLVAVIIGEGGSGGALALGVADRVFMLEHAIYSVISPEGCASILYREAAQAQKAAEALKLTARDLQQAGLIDGIIPEPLGGAQNDPDAVAQSLARLAFDEIAKLQKLTSEKRIQQRIEKYLRMGQWKEA